MTWTQGTDDVLVKIPVSDSTRGKDVAFEIHPTRLALRVAGQDTLVGSLDGAGEVDLDGE